MGKTCVRLGRRRTRLWIDGYGTLTTTWVVSREEALEIITGQGVVWREEDGRICILPSTETHVAWRIYIYSFLKHHLPPMWWRTALRHVSMLPPTDSEEGGKWLVKNLEGRDEKWRRGLAGHLVLGLEVEGYGSLMGLLAEYKWCSQGGRPCRVYRLPQTRSEAGELEPS